MDICIALPWVNRRRPFVALHIDPFPCYRVRGGVSRKYFHCGIIWGRRFMPHPGNGGTRSFWFDFLLPWSA